MIRLYYRAMRRMALGMRYPDLFTKACCFLVGLGIVHVIVCVILVGWKR